MRFTLAAATLAAFSCAGIADARELAVMKRIDAATVELSREDKSPAVIWLSEDTRIDAGDRLVDPQSRAAKVRLSIPAEQRLYVILQHADGTTTVAAERRLPLEHGSNFRDIGGYETKDGRTVRWGKAFRSGAMPLLTEKDYALVGQLGLDSVVDFRSLEEREINADEVDDRTGALFLSNDYSMTVLFKGIQAEGGENIYKGMEELLVPQYRALYRRILADEGAVLYHCSAGQDRTGVATALLYDVLGVDRETILNDYHLSTEWRRVEFEMPEFDPKDYPNNPMAQFYAAHPAGQPREANPLYTPSGASHLAQFFTYLDARYGGAEGYMKQALGFSDADIVKLRAIMLD